MAYQSVLPAAPFAPFAGIKTVASRVLYAMINNSMGARRLAYAQDLQALSDDQLASRGLKRDDIAAEAFRDLYWM